MRATCRWLGALLAVMVVAAARGEAQGGRPLTVNGSRALDFGTVIPGVPSIISRTDVAASGRFDVRGAKDSEVRVTLTLPVALTAPGGRTLPLTFTANDGGYNTVNDQPSARVFDPRTQLLARLSGQGRLFVYLGGTALPSNVQAAGAYAGTITLTAAYTGN